MGWENPAAGVCSVCWAGFCSSPHRLYLAISCFSLRRAGITSLSYYIQLAFCFPQTFRILKKMAHKRKMEIANISPNFINTINRVIEYNAWIQMANGFTLDYPLLRINLLLSLKWIHLFTKFHLAYLQFSIKLRFLMSDSIQILIRMLHIYINKLYLY